jgi:serine phosphatase RsbU (regulator of sigma subunit)
MKSLINILNIVILVIVVFNYLFFTLFGIDILSWEKLLSGLIIGIIFLFEAVLIIIIVNILYEKPILDLEYTIKKFLIGQLKNNDIQQKKYFNPHMQNISSFFFSTLSTLKNIKDEFIHGKEIKWEVELAREIQERLLSKKLLSIPSLNVIARSKPAWEIGGDSYDVIQQGDNYYMYVGDATGHGVGAGFIMMMVNALVSGFTRTFVSWAQILIETNAILKPRVKANLLMTMLLIRWNEKEKRLFMTGAGHGNLLIYKQNKKKCFKVKSWGTALGMIKDIAKLIKEQEILFEKNDIIVLYSDGISEAINQPNKTGSEQMFGEERIIQAIESAPNGSGKDYKTASNVFNNITIELSKFMGYQHAQLDDITLVVAHYRGDTYSIEEDTDHPIQEWFITEWKWNK